MRDPIPTSDATAAARDESRMRELDRKASAVAASLDMRATSLEERATSLESRATSLETRATALETHALGTIARAQRLTSVSTTATTQAGAHGVIVMPVAIKAGRLYRVWCPDLGLYSSAAGTAVVQITYTLDGSGPSPTSARLKQTTVVTSGNTAPASPVGHIQVGSDCTLTVLLSFYGITAATYTMVGQQDWPAVMYVDDLGVDPGPSGNVSL